MSLEFNSARYDVNQMISSITSSIVKELKEVYPQVVFNSPDKLYESLDDVFSDSKVPFVFIIDEWDRIMREKKEDAQSLKLYLEWLESIFKDQAYIALAYMTGILPIKKYGNQSALNMFNEFSMTDPDNFAPFIGVRGISALVYIMSGLSVLFGILIIIVATSKNKKHKKKDKEKTILIEDKKSKKDNNLEWTK